MARIFITGSSDGLGSLTAKKLISKGHTVYLHARNQQRAQDALDACPGASKVLIADLSSVEATKKLAAEVNALGPLDAIVHNAGLYTGQSGRKGAEGLPTLFTVNMLAPYILTALVNPRPKRQVYVSSGLHQGGKFGVDELLSSGYGDTKLQIIQLAFAVARRFEGAESNAVDPGWVPTKMGGASAMDDLGKAVDTFALLAAGEGAAKGKSAGYWYQGAQKAPKTGVEDIEGQDKLLRELEKISGVRFPA